MSKKFIVFLGETYYPEGQNKYIIENLKPHLA
jgi:hypothetical protein